MKVSRLISLPLVGFATMAMLSGCGNSAAPTGLDTGLDTTPPPAPLHVVRSNDDQGRPVLSWDASAAPDVASYGVYIYSPSPDRADAYLLVDDATDNNYVLPTATSIGTVTYRVRAVDTSGNKSAYSAAATFEVAPAGGGGDFTPIDIP